MKIVITGGHLAPALAVIEELSPNWQILFVGRKYGLEGDKAVTLEYKTITDSGIKFESIITGRLQRKITKYSIPSLLKLPMGFVQSLKILTEFRPDVVLSFGGYISIPIALACFFLGIPLVIHEQTFKAGVANKFASLIARKICISWKSSEKYFQRSKVLLTGNPIRKFSDKMQPSFLKQLSNEMIPLIYVTGGSSGSHTINVLIEGCIKNLLKHFQVIHQTGDAKEFNDFTRLEQFRNILDKKLQKRYVVTKFILPNEIGPILNASDLVVGRCGINTVSELLSFKKSALLIPLSYGQNREQQENAEFFESLGFGKMLIEKSLTSEILYKEIQALLQMRRIGAQFSPELDQLLSQNPAKKIEEVLHTVVHNAK